MVPRHIFWIMTDEQRTGTLAAENPDVRVMPALDALASESIEFAQAITPAPMCIPARTSLLAGELPGRTGVWRNRTEPGAVSPAPAVMDWFRGIGYRCVSLGKQHYELAALAFDQEESFILSRHVDYTGYLNGKDHRDYGGVRFPGPTEWIMAGTFPGPIEETSEWQLVDRAIGLTRSHDRREPLLMRLSFNAPHTPVAPPAGYLDRIPERIPEPASYLRTDPDWPRWLRLLQGSYANASWLAPEELTSMRRHYYAQCAFLDDMIARFIRFLRESGLYEESVIVYCSDHGAHLGDHGLVQKQSFFGESVTVPCLIRAPGLAPARVSSPISLLSLLPTAGALAGTAPPARLAPLDVSRSLVERGDIDPRPVVSQGRLNPKLLDCDDRIVMVQDGSIRAVFDIDAPTDRELIFDLAADPCEVNSLDGTEQGRSTLDRMRTIAVQSVAG